MTDGINPGRGRDAGRHADRQVRIQNRHSTGGFLIATRHFHVCLRIGNQGERLRLTSRTRRCGDCNQGQHWFGCFSHPPIVAHLSAIREQEIDPFCAVHRAATPDGHDQIDIFAPGNHETTIDIIGCRIWLDVVKRRDLESCRFQ